MSAALAALQEHSLRLLAAVRAGSEDVLSELLHTRAERLQGFTAALAAGERVTEEDARKLAALEAEIVEALRGRRDAVAAELAALRRGRMAGAAYRGVPAGEARFLDRQG